MNEVAICDLIAPHYAGIVEDTRDAFADFDHMVEVSAQPSVLRARAKFTSCRLAHRFEQRHGRDPLAPTRIHDIDGMNILIIEGEEFGVGLRLKKFDCDYRTCNHQSDNQDELRRSGRFATPNLPHTETIS